VPEKRWRGSADRLLETGATWAFSHRGQITLTRRPNLPPIPVACRERATIMLGNVADRSLDNLAALRGRLTSETCKLQKRQTSSVLILWSNIATIGTSDDPIRPVTCRNSTLFGKGRPWQRSNINTSTLIREPAKQVWLTMRSEARTIEIRTACDIHRHGLGSPPLA
jgi:hypothetical protein